MKEKKPFAKKSFGQNFLVDPNFINKIISALNPQQNETIIEIGPGRGALTAELVQSAANVFAIEIDRDLIPILQNEFQKFENFTLIEADALKIDFSEISKNKKQPVKLVANLPYYISTAILQRLIAQKECFSEMVLMLQREVVERITAEPGNSERGYLSVLIEAYCEAEKLFDVPPNAFRPVPKVWSSVVKINFEQSRQITLVIENERKFWEIVSAGFLQKRKTILNNLKSVSGDLSNLIEKNGGAIKVLEKSGIEPQLRAEALTLAQWNQLARVLFD